MSDHKTAGFLDTHWHIWWAGWLLVLAIVVWFVIIRPLLINRAVKVLKKYAKKPRAKIGVMKLSINFGVIPYTIAIGIFLIIIFDIWDNRIVQGSSAFGLIGLITVGAIQTKMGSGFLSGYEVMLTGGFDEGDEIGYCNHWGTVYKEGVVKTIGTHATKFRGADNLEFTVTNRELLKASYIINFSRADFYFVTVPIVPMEEDMMQRAAELIGQLIDRKTVKELLDLNGKTYTWWKTNCNSGKDVTPRQWGRIINPGIDYKAEVPSIKLPVFNRLEANDVHQFVRTQIDGATPFLPAIEKKVTLKPEKKALPLPHLPRRRHATIVTETNGAPAPAKPPVQFAKPPVKTPIEVKEIE